jgi:serine/threonine-protein kinase
MSQVDREASEDTLAWVIEGNRVSLGDLTGLTLGDFQVDRLLGRGGMGEVYLATQISLNRPVALKVLRPDFLTKGAYLSRFNAEATAIAKLNHPCIVHVYAIGNVDQIHFIAMEYVEGTNLRDYIRKKGALDLPLALSIMRQTGQAIGAAGEQGLIHRDVKPENILITRRGRVKVADFGLCRDLEGKNLHLTQSGVTLGTPLYMSPEQVQGHPIDHRSDLYSLGVTFYHMLAGEPPFQAESAVALALKHVREIPRSLLVHRPDLPIEVDRLVMKLLAKDLSDRYQSAAEMLADLAGIRDAVQLGATAVIPAASSSSLVATQEFPVPPAQGEPAPRAPGPSTAESPTGDRHVAAVRLMRPDELAVGSSRPALERTVRFSGAAAVLAGVVCLCLGALTGWAARAPDVQSLPSDSTRNLPGLWLEPRWSTILKQNSSEEQLRYAQFCAPRDEWIAAWLAVPGHYPHAHDSISKAYLQLARIWYRRNDPEALGVLESELSQWNEAQERDQELAAWARIAIMLRTGDLEGVVKAFTKLTQAGVNNLYDRELVELNLEVCADALQVVLNSGSQAMAEPLRKAMRQLMWQFYRIEAGELAGPARRGSGRRAVAGPGR